MATIYDWQDYQNKPVAKCVCGSTTFYILVNDYGDSWDKIIGTECMECGEIINWVTAEKISGI
jgi:hypothetical protein